MAKATWVPLAYLSERGQQIKVFSQLARKARELGFMIPTMYSKATSDEKYQGATVLDAQTGAYYGPITALDFASLYPSIMRAHNLCYSSLVIDPRFANVPGVVYEQYGPYRFAQGVPSLLPAILNELAAFRKKAKKLMAQTEGTPMEAVYNGQQLAYKISMNSIYGFTGATKGMLPCVAIASTVTMRGRQMIEETKNYVEEHFPGAKVRYGDSVTGDTPILFRKDGRTFMGNICWLGINKEWSPYEGFLKEGTDKEMIELEGFESWTHLGWKPIRRVIRHRCNKKIFEVITPSGCVEVTEDHSLLNPSLEQVKPKDVSIGDKLFHLFPEFDTVDHYWDYLAKTKSLTNENFASIDEANLRWPRRRTRGQIQYLRLSKLGANVTICKDGMISWTDRKVKRDPYEIISIKEVEHDNNRYVYDLETEAGTFQAGVGCMIVKNTDSVMVEFDVQGRKGQDAIDYSWEQGELASEQCSKLFKAPNDLELEKVYCPYFLYSKKRYAAKMYEKKGDSVVFKKIDVKGLQVVRRDTCMYVRGVLKHLLDLVLNSEDPRPAIEYARTSAKLLLKGKVDPKELTMSKQLGADYKTRVPHVEVRDKIRKRAPGSEPQNGDRVAFLITKVPGLLCDKAEDPSWVMDNKIPLDYVYYFEHQLVKPVCDLLEPLVGANPFQTIFKSVDYLTTPPISNYFTRKT
jgi:hypothetical protein